ncbi:MAG: maleylpyruvate isomerase N-terminal domain-containing protein [Actinomycetota bacterium]|nr:maleylpyruvate isomerase N-terminal domain-containing protein [Actinomycetota bacterium]
MTKAAIDALRAEHAHALELFDSLTDAEWGRPSACDGWRVQDVAQHMAATFHMIADRASIEVGDGPNTEQNAEVPVRARRDWTVAQVRAEYREWSEKGIATLAAMQEPPLAEMVVPLADLGSHPLHLLGNAIAFDHYCHLRHDIGVAVRRAADLPHDPLALEVSVEWMLAGVPQMCAEALQGCTTGVAFVFTDLHHVLYTLRPGAPGELWQVAHGTDAALPVCVTSAHEFVSWATKRSDWRPHVQLTNQAAAATLDALNII